MTKSICKKILFILPVMHGGGAERVAAQIANEMHSRGIKVTFVLTSDALKQVKRTDLSEDIPLITVQDSLGKEGTISKLCYGIKGLFSSLLCKPFETLGKPVPAYFAKISLSAEHHREIRKMKDIISEQKYATVISFLQPSIPITLLAAKNLPNKVILSERGNPQRLMKKRYGRKFIEKYYQRADRIVFQTDDARNVYPRNVAEKGVVISNPIKANLPEPYHGERNKYITTFCRISPEKDLLTLIKAFYLVHQKHPDYQLKIIGDAINENEIQYKQELFEYIQKHDLINYIVFKPFTKRVHKEIIHDAMYVNSSVTEGLSNAMLESMAIGLPVICTDCPIGGARATIIHEVNGLLTEVGNAEKLADKMLLLIDNNVLSNQISNDSVKVRKEKSLQSITDQWVGVL